MGRKWLIGGVARIYKPGSKNDSIVILEGPQGGLKSTTLRTLAGSDEFFSDDISELGSKDSVMQTRGVWIVELSELDSMSRPEVSKVKAFMSRQIDRIRLPYGKRVEAFPRECIFAGTVNHDTYLKDETGGRRFWPVKCGTILIESLRRDRDQLWAEARERFQAGETWWLDTEVLMEAAAEQAQERYEGDAWDSLILSWATERIAAGSTSISVPEVLEKCLEKRKDQWTRGDEMRVARCLRSARWERYRDRKRKMEWRYRPLFPTKSWEQDGDGNTASD